MIILFIEILAIFIFGLILATIIIDERNRWTRNFRLVKLKGYWDGSERRSVERLNINLETRYIINGKTQETKSMDISTKGIRLLLDERLEKNTPLRLEIKLPKENHLIKVNGEVVWTREAIENEKNSTKRLFNTGIQFLKFRNGQDEKRLFNFIYGLQTDKL